MKTIAGAANAMLLVLMVGGCGSSVDPEERAYASTSHDNEDINEDREDFDEDAVRERAEQDVADEGYSGPCTSDCSGHDAGFSWAADGNVDGGLSSSRSFDEGQAAYEEAVEERMDEYRQAYEGGEDQDY